MPTHPENLHFPSQAKTSASTTTSPPWNPVGGELLPHHRRICELAVQGLAASRIRYRLVREGKRMHSGSIKRILQSEAAREYMSLYSSQYYGGTAGLAAAAADRLPEALHTEIEIMRNPLSGVRHRLAASQDVLDRAGLPKISRQEQENKTPTQVIINLLPSQLAQFSAAPAEIEAKVVPLLDNPSSSDD